MTSFARPRVAVVIGIVLGASLLGGCSSVPNLPTLGGTHQSTASTLEAVAKQFYDCLTNAGIPADLNANGQGQLTMVQVRGDTVMWRYANGSGGAVSNSSDPAGQQAMNDFFADTSGTPALVVDGVDHSAEWTQCLTQSGYDDQAAQGPMVMDPTYMQQQLQSNNKWAACARENGWPGVKDSVMPTKTAANSQQWPTVLLPATITEDQLRQLVAACPTFDKEQADKMSTWNGTGPPTDYLPAPSIGFDLPFMQGNTDPNFTPNPEQQAQLDRVGRLYDILNEAANAYYQQQTNGPTAVVPAPAPS